MRPTRRMLLAIFRRCYVSSKAMIGTIMSNPDSTQPSIISNQASSKHSINRHIWIALVPSFIDQVQIRQQLRKATPNLAAPSAISAAAAETLMLSAYRTLKCASSWISASLRVLGRRRRTMGIRCASRQLLCDLYKSSSREDPASLWQHA